jgi:hypothetical protein
MATWICDAGTNGGTVRMIHIARIALRRGSAWVIPAVPATVVTGYLGWGAWIFIREGREGGWLRHSHDWWLVILQPQNNWAILATVLLWLAALVCYWWPRRLRAQTVGLTIVVAMVAIGGALGAASLIPCRHGQTGTSVMAGVLDLFVGQPAAYPSATAGVCPPVPPPPALQLASVVCLAATLVGALTAAAVLWRQPVGRLRARLVRDATVLVGLDAMTISLLRRLAGDARRPGRIVVIEPDPGHPMLDDARATGARIMIGDPTIPHVLLPVLAGRRGCALSYLYALRQDVLENEAILAAAGEILCLYRPDAERQPHLIARIDDPRHADDWRGRHSGISDLWFEDALSPQETTARALVTRLQRTGARQLLLCGDSTLALAILLELAYRAWERRGLDRAAALGRRALPPPAVAAAAGRQAPGSRQVDSVVLVDRRAEDLRREYLATSPRSMSEAFAAVRLEPVPWQDHLLALLDDMAPAQRSCTAVVVADLPTEGSMHETGRVARLHPGMHVFVLSSDGAGVSEAIFDHLQPFQRALLVDDLAPEDTWTRIARHWHECYRLRYPALNGDSRASAGRPWEELDEFIRRDNILQLRSVMTAVAARGRSWVPARAVRPGSFVELSRQDLEEVARAEHTRWYLRRRDAGWRSAGGEHGDNARVNATVVPWTERPAEQRAGTVRYVQTQIEQLEDFGFMPVVPDGGPAQAARFHRVGTVRARRLSGRRPWTRRSGDQLSGDPGDWHVVDDSGDQRTVRDPVFRAAHEPLGGDRYNRTGTYRAWRVSEEFILRTLEGRAVAQPGDWIVEGVHGERWPVTDDQFRRTYRAADAVGRA